MALAKDHRIENSAMCLNHAYTYYESEFGGSSVQGSDQSSPGLYGIDDQPKKVFEEGDSFAKNFAISNSSSLSSPSSSNSSGLGYPTLKYQSEEGNSIISFKAGYGNFPHTNGSLLSFEQNEQIFHQSSYSRMSNQEDFSIWEDNMHHNYQNQLNPKCSNPNPGLLASPSKIATVSSHGSARNAVQFGWISPELTTTTSGIEDLGREEASLNKRPYMEKSTQPHKKQCTSPIKQLTPTSSPSKDPQSIAAKNRRERISERLKVLQELVPNGSKVDLVTMLEKAISYVKFLQLQVKVLATDEFWPAQGGKAPNLSQVKEAIDVILASQRDRNSSSN